jgi:glycosyltransferase involved in cell wall biosynthesis
MPKISVIIPVYNRGDLLARTINSVINQTFTDFELIVVDDGSTDNTKDVVQDFVKKDSRVKYFRQKNSGGAAGPKNTAIKYCTGEYVAYLDHDDEWFPTKLEKQLKIFENSSRNLGLVSCNILIVNQSKNLRESRMMLSNPSIADMLLRPSSYAFSNSSVLIPKTVIDIVGPRDENLKVSDDHDYFLRVALAGFKFDFVDEVLVKYYFGDNSNLSANFKKISVDYESFFKKHKVIIEKDRVTLAVWCRNLGAAYFLIGEESKARSLYFRSILLHPSLESIIVTGCSLFGRRFYMALRRFKNRNNILS